MVPLVSCDNTDGKAKVLDKFPAAKHWLRAEQRENAIAYSQGALSTQHSMTAFRLQVQENGNQGIILETRGSKQYG